MAIAKGNTSIAETLIEKGADINIQDKDGYTPLHWAIAKENRRIAEILIEKGANLDKKDIQNKTPLQEAISWGNTEIAKALIEKCTNVNISDNYGNTLLHIAAITGNIPIILALIDKGAQVNTRNSSKASALDLARSTNYTNKQEILDSLIKNGARITSNEQRILLGSTILTTLATIVLITASILLPNFSIIFAIVTGVLSMALCDSYFKEGPNITINKPTIVPINTHRFPNSITPEKVNLNSQKHEKDLVAHFEDKKLKNK